MKARSVIAVLVMAAGAVGVPVIAWAHQRQAAPRSERTHPRVSPTTGTPRTAFRLAFRLRETPGHHGYLETDYQVQVAPHQGAPSSCWPPQPTSITSGHRGQEAKISLKPPTGGWCVGRYRVTVFLERGPYCPPPQNGQPQPCPEFATQEMNTGQTRFTIGRTQPAAWRTSRP
jgi:hypothetical protein